MSGDRRGPAHKAAETPERGRGRGGYREGARGIFGSSRYVAGGQVARPSNGQPAGVVRCKITGLYLRPLLGGPLGDGP